MSNPLEPRRFQPEGIEERVAEVKKLLDIENSKHDIGVVIVGTAGIGKSTLADSVIHSLNFPSTDFIFCKVTIDQKTPDKTSYIIKLQSDIIFHFTKDVLYLQDTKQGQQKLKEAMASKSCFLYIDNVVDWSYIKDLLPRELLPENPRKKSELENQSHNPSKEKSKLEKLQSQRLSKQKSKLEKSQSQNPSKEKSKVQKSPNPTKEKSAENSEEQMQKTKIRILITSRQKDLKPLLNNNFYEYEIGELSADTANKLLSAAILQSEKPVQDFDEVHKIAELAAACGGHPLLLSIFGNHLKGHRDQGSYEEATKALREGNIDRYNAGDEELLSEKLMFVYDRMDEEGQEAFLDVCTYFHGFSWGLVSYILDTSTLESLHNKKLVKRDADKVIVHDILRLMGAKKAKDTRLMNYEEFFNINDDKSKLKSVKGMVLLNRTFVATVQTRHLNAMRHSLRFLVLGDWVRVDGPPCERAFEKLRYLRLGDLKDFPFKDVSKMKKLNVLENSSKSGMELVQLPPSVKYLSHQIPYRDCNEFATLPLKNLKYLKELIVQTKSSVRLPEGFKLPASLEHLRLISCEQLPETFGHLSALQNLALDNCDFTSLHQAFTQCDQLRTLSMQGCTNMIYIPNGILESLCSLKDLRLIGCASLKKLPSDLDMLTALETLDIGECENLKVLPQTLGGLKSLKTFALNGCISLQNLPNSFGTLCIKHLKLEFLTSLKEIPQSLGSISCLETLSLKSCHSLEYVPDSLVQLTNLDNLVVEDCVKLRALPKNFDQLCSLKEILLSSCPLLTRLPEGFEGLKTLKCMTLTDCSSLEDLPMCFEMPPYLEKLYLIGLFLTRLPDGLGKLKELKILYVRRCCKFQTVPQDFENVTASELSFIRCPMLEGTTMDKIVKLQNCHCVYIYDSTKLIERWNELEEENENLPMLVLSSLPVAKELRRALRVGLFCGKCIQLDNTGMELNDNSSFSIRSDTTIALISLQMDQHELLQPIVDMANERANRYCEGQLRIIYVCRRSDSDALNEEDEREKIRKMLLLLPQGISYAIPSTDIRRVSLIGLIVFGNPNVFSDGSGPRLLCFMGDVRKYFEAYRIVGLVKIVTENEILKKSKQKLPISENPDEDIKISDGIVEFINCICKGSGLSDENMVDEFIQKLKNSNINHFSDKQVQVDHLKGKTVAIILIDQNYPECTRLQQIYHDFKLKYSNFEVIWIPLPEENDYGFGTYCRSIQGMPWLTLTDPKLIKTNDVEDRSPRVIIINRGGRIGSPNALPLLMSRGADFADAYPFTRGSLSKLDMKSSLEILFHSTEIKELNKLIFLYSEPPGQKLKMKCTLEKIVQIHGKGNFEIVYVGRYFAERNITAILQKTYEDATGSMNWTKLSFRDMMTFWYRCKYLSDEVVQEPNSASTLNRLLKALLDEKRWLVVVDGDGMVTANGIDVAEMASELTDEKDELHNEKHEELSDVVSDKQDDEVDIRIKKELREFGKGQMQ